MKRYKPTRDTETLTTTNTETLKQESQRLTTKSQRLTTRVTETLHNNKHRDTHNKSHRDTHNKRQNTCIFSIVLLNLILPKTESILRGNRSLLDSIFVLKPQRG